MFISPDESNFSNSNFKQKQYSDFRNIKSALLLELHSDENTHVFIFIIDNDSNTNNKIIIEVLTSWVEGLSSLG